MAVLGSIEDNQFNSFKLTPNGNKVARRICADATDPIPVVLTNVQPGGIEVKNLYTEVASVASATETTIVSYTVPVGKVAEVYIAEISGTNVSEFRVKVNGSTIGMKRSYFTEYNQTFHFAIGVQEGLRISAGDVLIVTARHTRTAVADYNGRLLVAENDA